MFGKGLREENDTLKKWVKKYTVMIEPQEQIDKLEQEISALKDTSIKVGDKVMIKKDMTKVYEVESIREKINDPCYFSMPCGMPLGTTVTVTNKDLTQTKYSLDNNKVYTSDQILPYREDSHLLAQEIKKLK